MKVKILRSYIDNISYDDAVDRLVYLSRKKCGYVCMVNVHMLIEAFDDQSFSKIVNEADLTLPDGMPVANAMRLFYGVDQERIAGMDVFPSLLRRCHIEGLKVFILGSSDYILSLIKKKTNDDYPMLCLDCFSPPYGDFSDADKKKIIDNINKASPNIIIVALGCPKQEKWMYENHKVVDACMIGLGGALTVYSGAVSRAPKFLQDSGFEWLYRLCQEPRRLWKRYFYTNLKFSILIFGQMIKALYYKVK